MFACSHMSMDAAKTEPVERSHCCPTPLCQLPRVALVCLPGLRPPTLGALFLRITSLSKQLPAARGCPRWSQLPGSSCICFMTPVMKP